MTGPTRSTPAPARQVQPPRPPNAWILYRSDRFKDMREMNPGISQANVSKLIAQMWKHESEEVKQYYDQLAEKAKLKHQELYPNYRFCPQRKEEKLRAREEMKQNRRAKKSKARPATTPDAEATATPSVTTLPLPTLPAMPRPYFYTGYSSNTVLPQPCALPFSLEALYGPGGPSPPMSAAPSPAPYEASYPSTSNQNAGLASQNSEIVILDIPINQTNFTFAEFQQGGSGSSSSNSTVSTPPNHGFDFENIDMNNIVVPPPQGDFEVASGSPAPTMDYIGHLFSDHAFQQCIAELEKDVSKSPPATTSSIHDELESLFISPSVPAVQQQEPAELSQEMMTYINFDAVEGSSEDILPAQSPLSTSTTVILPAVSSLTTVAPHQVRLQNPQPADPMPIFTQMTNTPTVASGPSYVPPSGAIYSSTRRVAGSWKPSFPSHVEDPILSWMLSTS